MLEEQCPHTQLCTSWLYRNTERRLLGKSRFLRIDLCWKSRWLRRWRGTHIERRRPAWWWCWTQVGVLGRGWGLISGPSWRLRPGRFWTGVGSFYGQSAEIPTTAADLRGRFRFGRRIHGFARLRVVGKAVGGQEKVHFPYQKREHCRCLVGVVDMRIGEVVHGGRTHCGGTLKVRFGEEDDDDTPLQFSEQIGIVFWHHIHHHHSIWYWIIDISFTFSSTPNKKIIFLMNSNSCINNLERYVFINLVEMWKMFIRDILVLTQWHDIFSKKLK